MIKQYHKLVLLTILLVALIGCGQSTETLSSNLQRVNNRITVFSSLPSDRIDDYLTDFRAKNPEVEVELVFDTAANLTEMLIASEQNQRPDVIWGLPVANALHLEWLDLLKPFEPSELDQIAPRFYDTNRPPHWVGTAARVLVFCVNTERSAELNLPIPQTWEELLDPIYQGHITAPSSTTSGSGYLVLGTILELYEETQGWQYLEALDQQIDYYAVDVKVACQLAADGDVPIAISFDYRGAQRQDAGDPIELVYPADGVGWDMEVTGLVRKDAVTDAAKTFVDWASSADALKLYAEDREILSAYDDTSETVDPENADSRSNPAHAVLLDQDTPWISANRERIMREWSDRFASKITIVEESNSP